MLDIGLPPKELNAAFFRWLQGAGCELSVSFATFRPMAKETRAWLAGHIAGPLPADLSVFYDHCDPWGMLKPSRSTWQQVSAFVEQRCGKQAPLLPIDLGGVQGHYVVARATHEGIGEILEVSSAREGHKASCDGLRAYLVGLVEDEARLSSNPK